MCQCNFCKARRGEITPEAYKKILENDIIRYDKILADKNSTKNDKWCAEVNKDEGEQVLQAVKDGTFLAKEKSNV